MAAVVLVLVLFLVPSSSAQAPPAVRHEHYYYGFLAWSGGGRIAWEKVSDVPSGGPGTTGVQEYVGETTGAPSVDVFTSEPLPRTIHLNVSRAILLHVYMKPVCFAGTKVELRTGDALVAGHVSPREKAKFGSPDYPQATPAANGYCLGEFSMHSEVSVLPAGSVLKVHLTHGRGFSGTFELAQSTPYVYGLKDGPSQLLIPAYPDYEVPFRTGQEDGGLSPSGEPSNTAWMPGLSSILPGMGLAFGGRRHRRTARGAVAVLVMVSLAACMDGGRDGAVNTAPTESGQTGGEATYTIQPGGGAGGAPGSSGSISGQVSDPYKRAVARARVSLIGTEFFTDTSLGGAFVFKAVPSGRFQYRIEAAEFRAFQDELVVVAGNMTKVDVVLEPLDAGAGDAAPHKHDRWLPDLKKTVLERDVFFRYSGGAVADSITNTVPDASYCYSPCTVQFEFSALPERPLVLPGAREIEVTVTIPGVHNMYTSWVTFGDSSRMSGASMFPRAMGVPTRIQTNWEMNDNGHANFSNWVIQVSVAGPAVASQRIHVEIVQHKGVVPLEPAHPDWWGGKDVLTVVENSRMDLFHWCGFYECEFNDRTYSQFTIPWWWVPIIVPADAVWLECVLIQETNRDPHPQWGLKIHPGGLPMNSPAASYNHFPPPKVEGSTYRFVYPLKAGDADPIYARSTSALIFPTDLAPNDPVTGRNTYFSLEDRAGGRWWLNLTVVAHRDALPTGT